MSTRPDTRTPDRAPAASGARPNSGWLLAAGFLVLAAAFMFTGSQTRIPTASTPVVDAALLDPGPRRTVLGDPPTVLIAGFEQRCNACHKLFQSSWDGRRPLTQHTHIILAHGINNQCDNCHAREDREQLVLHDGSSVTFSRTETLCAQCHGPVFRDWERGTHGKTLGSWDLSSPLARRLSCAECHDPHAPAYPPIAPLPGPNTLRMGTPAPDAGQHHDDRNPLRRWAHTPEHGGNH
ncbi:MAG: hypothetical protein KDA21_13675 [Phycisphaerales bacterium]|nr:hypothetical protein [Phycisphaerales bacterium]